MAQPLPHHHTGSNPSPKQFVLCFDGTGNKFAGDESDSNVLKIFRVGGTAPVEVKYALTILADA